MIQLDGTLSDLARLRSGSEPIVSLYLDVRWSDEQQRERVRLFVQDGVRHALAHYLPESPGREGLERTLGRIEGLVGNLTAQVYEADKNGLALFACDGLGLWRPLFFRRSFRNEICLDAVPHLTQLVRLASDVEPALVIVPGPDGADVYHVSLGDLALKERLRGFVPRGDAERLDAGTGKPGRSHERERKDERREEGFVRRNRRAAVAEVTRLFDDGPRRRIVLVGTSENVAAFERELPDRVRGRVIARLPCPREWGSANGLRKDGVVAGASKAVLDHVKVEELRTVDVVIGEALRGGLAVVGPEDVILAVNEGRVHRLVVEADLARTGWRCDHCDALGATDGERSVCPYCGGDLHSVRDLREALVARTLAEGGDVEVVSRGSRLHSYRGVGAFLRQSAPTGLRGASQPWPTAPGASQP